MGSSEKKDAGRMKKPKKKPLDTVYEFIQTKVPPEVKQAIIDGATSRYISMGAYLRQILVEKFGGKS